MLRIRQARLAEIVALGSRLPEFSNPPTGKQYHDRLTGVRHLLLLAEWEGMPAGFKVGYEREESFYSWMGGVLPEFRRLGIARALADAQEEWARRQGFGQIVFKTRNQHKNMLLFALQNGFDIIGFTEKETVETNRILLRKVL